MKPLSSRDLTNRDQLEQGELLARDLHRRFAGDQAPPFYGTVTITYRYQDSVINSVSGTFAGEALPPKRAAAALKVAG